MKRNKPGIFSKKIKLYYTYNEYVSILTCTNFSASNWAACIKNKYYRNSLILKNIRTNTTKEITWKSGKYDIIGIVSNPLTKYFPSHEQIIYE